MLKQRTQFIRNILYVADLAIVTASFFLTYHLFRNFDLVYKGDLFPQVDLVRSPADLNFYMGAYFAALATWAVLLWARGQYQLRVQTFLKVAAVQLVNGGIFFGVFTSAVFLLKLEFISRFFTVFYSALTVVFIIAARFAVLGAAYHFRRKGFNYRNILLVGTGSRAQDFLRLVARHKEWGFRVIGALDRSPDRVGQSIENIRVIGTLDHLSRMLENNVVDEVVFVVPRDWLKEIEKSILYCESVGVPATLSTDFFDLEIAQGVPREMEGKTFLTFETRQLRDPELLVKRTADIVLSALILALTSPVLIAAAAAVRLTSKGPAFFKQVRCGRNGREFVLYKFRSMVEGAEKQLEQLRPFNEMTGPVFKMENDPRVTPIGKLLRRTSLDEFPQFWNVLKGDMSIVGPRPPLPAEVAQYEPWQRRRLSMKPGITCLWQVYGRGRVDFELWMKLDLRYIDRWSLWLDFKIIAWTIAVVLSGRGAK